MRARYPHDKLFGHSSFTELKDRWSGTLILLGQPAEETGDGANAMLRDNLYTNFPRPDFAIALHDKPELETGKVGYTPGYSMASATRSTSKSEVLVDTAQRRKTRKIRL